MHKKNRVENKNNKKKKIVFKGKAQTQIFFTKTNILRNYIIIIIIFYILLKNHFHY